MDALWITLTFLLACLGGWPVTAGLLRLSRSRAVAAVDHAERPAPLDDPRHSDPAADSTTELPPATLPAPPTPPATDLAPGAPAAPPARASPPVVLRGGLIIGVLERGAVVLAILANQPVAIAYVVAIKGLGRYPELKDTPAASERFIIGTLGSMLWAAGIAALVKVLLL